MPEIAHSIIEGAIVADDWIFGVDGGGNTDTDPLFAALQPASGGNPTSAGDYRLQAGMKTSLTGPART